MYPPDQATAQLWSLHTDVPVPEVPCSWNEQAGLACIEGEAWTWDDLVDFDRPLALEVITPERFSAEVLLLGIENSTGWVLTGEGVAQVSLGELAPYWTGRYRFFWHPPKGFETSVMLGQKRDVVAAIAEMFARLDGQPEPLAGRYFNKALQQRVRMFQLEHGLEADGQVGEKTLLKLNEQLGVDITAAQARQQLASASPGASEQ
jgi:general secretion pathway protein A